MPLSLPYKKRDVAFGEQSDLSIYTYGGAGMQRHAGLIWSGPSSFLLLFSSSCCCRHGCMHVAKDMKDYNISNIILRHVYERKS